jgi:hypothetical protein
MTFIPYLLKNVFVTCLQLNFACFLTLIFLSGSVNTCVSHGPTRHMFLEVDRVEGF